MESMLTTNARARLEKQQYRIVGSHSAVKTCGWTKKMVRGEGGCYKLKFYGIMSHQCLQMTTSMSCANRCTFCWRGYKAPVSKEWKWTVDDPVMILEGSETAHHDLLIGFKGNEKATLYSQSTEIKHAALSLTGEPITYPRINEIIKEFHKRGISTFLVTNATYPDQIRDLAPVTQLYLSVDAPNKDLLKEVDVPLFPDYWERLQQSLSHLSRKSQRTCIRLTIIKGVNDIEPENYAILIRKGDPDFIEVKGYMFIGASRQRLNMANMPYHDDVCEFSKQIKAHLPEYEIVSEHKPSRVVMLAKKELKQEGIWHTWIDFEKFTELATSKSEFCTEDYLRETPKSSLGKNIGTLTESGVDEETEETSFWVEVKPDDGLI